MQSMTRYHYPNTVHSFSILFSNVCLHVCICIVHFQSSISRSPTYSTLHSSTLTAQGRVAQFWSDRGDHCFWCLRKRMALRSDHEETHGQDPFAVISPIQPCSLFLRETRAITPLGNGPTPCGIPAAGYQSLSHFLVDTRRTLPF